MAVCAFAAATWLACGGKTTAAPGAADSGPPEASDGGSDGGALTCDEQTAAGRVALNAAVAAAQEDLGCAADEDCTVVLLMTTCYGEQCESAVVNQAAAMQLSAAITKINSTTCAGYEENGCPPTCCVPCPPSLRPSCVAGTCQDYVPGTDAGAP
jgi:hypothetical protein